MVFARCCRWTPAACLWLAASWVFAGPAEDQYSVAAGHYTAERWRLAAEEFTAFLTQFPDHQTADLVRFYLGESLVQQGQYGEARRRFAEFLENQPEHKHAPQARFRIGEAAYLSGDRAAARRDFEDFRKRHPEHSLNELVLTYLGELALSRGDAEAAKNYYATVLEKHPQSPLRDASRFGLAQALESLGDMAGADRFYRYVASQTKSDLADDAQFRLGLMLHRLRHYEQAERELRRLQAEFPQSEHRPHAIYWLAKSQFASQNWEGAAATLATIQVATDHELAPAIAFTAGDALARLGRTEEAHRRLGEVVANWPESEWADDALQLRTDLALATGDAHAVDALATDFQSRYPSSPLTPSVRLAHGRSLLHREKYGEASAVFEQLLASAAESASSQGKTTENTYRYYLALAKLGAGENEAALAAVAPVRLDEVSPELAGGVRATQAAALVGLERFEEAVPVLKTYLESQPNGPDAPKCRAQLVVALAKSGRLSEAAKAHEEMSQRNRDHAHFLPATDFLAEAAYAAGEREMARRLFTILAEEGNPQQYAAKGLSGLAWLEFDRDDPEQSAAAFERLVREHPDSKLAAEAAMMQGRSLQRLGRTEPAAAMFRLVLDKYSDSESAPAAIKALARLYDQQGKDAEAAALYERYAAEHPQAPDIDSVLYQWAWALTDSNQSEQAEAVFSRLVNEHRQSQYWADAAYRLAERAVHAKNYERAKQLTQQIVQAEPEGEVLAHALYLQAQIAAVEEQWPTVSSSALRLIEKFPDTSLKAPALYLAAESDYRQHRFDEAGKRLAELAPLAEQSGEDWAAMVPLRQAQVLAHQKQWREAHEIAAGVAARFPDFRQQYEADYLIGRCLMAQAKFHDARAAFERVIRSTTGGRTETAAMAQWMIGETYFHQKNHLEAIKAYHRVERLFPYPRWQAGALLQSAKCHEHRGEFHDALKLYAQILKDYPDTPFTEEAAQRLRTAQQRAALTPTP